MGTVELNTPMDTPVRMRPEMSMSYDTARKDTATPPRYTKHVIISVIRRPRRSCSSPATAAPNVAPIASAAPINPYALLVESVSPNSVAA